ncbi:MAG: phosphatase PAP2 family protein [Muribaculaceae bacterium]|nr:phosphatase PAP2 family protein [Muribaculaceae bacterium]
MLDYLNTIDQQALIAINSWHAPYFDQLMWCITSKLSWALILVAVLVALRHDRRQALLVIATLVLTILISDQISSGLIKHTVERLRPSHNPDLASSLHLVNGYTGGLYGFTSSHAANSFSVAMVLSLMFASRRVTVALMSWAMLQCYSRMYLGVHYPGDIIGGTLVGLLVGWLVYRLWQWTEHRWMHHYQPIFTRHDATMVASSVYVTLAFLAVLAVFI